MTEECDIVLRKVVQDPVNNLGQPNACLWKIITEACFPSIFRLITAINFDAPRYEVRGYWSVVR